MQRDISRRRQVCLPVVPGTVGGRGESVAAVVVIVITLAVAAALASAGHDLQAVAAFTVVVLGAAVSAARRVRTGGSRQAG